VPADRNKLLLLANTPYDRYQCWSEGDFKLAHYFITLEAGWKLSKSSEGGVNAWGYSYLLYINPRTKGACLARGALQVITRPDYPGELTTIGS
jgi:hypothetical protein